MKLRYKIAGGLLLLVLAGLATFAIALSHDAPCGEVPALSTRASRMKAVVRHCYGGPEVLELAQVDKPVPAANQVLVRVRAAAVNPVDWHFMRGKPYIMRLGSGFGRPKSPRLGVDFAGTVEAVGQDVTRFKPGDAVFGGRDGALAEYVTVAEDRALVPMPASLTFAQAAAVGVAGVTALQAVRDQGRVRPGQKVLINGASGGVGTFAVQVAKAFGAEVTGVCSTRNVPLVRSIGADHVIDYRQADFTRGGQRYDVILDNVANRPLSAIRRVLAPGGTYVLIGGGGPDDGPWFGPFARVIQALVLSQFVSQDMGMFLAELNRQDLAVLSELIQSGQVTPVIDRRYPLGDVAEAIRYLETGRARGKVVIEVD